MLTALIRSFPSRQFCLSNVLFWLVLTTIAADHTHRTRIFYDRPSNFFITWIEYLPWWGNWAIVAPFVIATIKLIKIDERHWCFFAAQNLLLMIATMLAYWGLTLVGASMVHNNGNFSLEMLSTMLQHLLVSPMHMDLLVYIAIASLGFTMHYYQSNKEQAVRNQTLANQLLKAELNSLKSQLSPHFLFNALNTISGLIRLKHENEAVTALSELSKMFRKVLENQKNQLTSLEVEMEFITSYLSIQKMRFENKLALELNVEEKALQANIPFMLLHTLVENAVQHGSQLESDENLLKLDVAIRNQHLQINLVNKVAKLDKNKGFGIGLKNCRQRLDHIYGSGYQLVCNETADGYYSTVLSLPLEELDA